MTEELRHFSEYLNKELATHSLVQDLKRDREMRQRFRDDEATVLAEYAGLTEEEKRAIAARDFRALYELGVHPYLLGQLSRLIFGTVEGAGSSEASSALVRSLTGK
jgi:Aromatic-ring-opening dioxygenase LigAB, LigA subunit